MGTNGKINALKDFVWGGFTLGDFPANDFQCRTEQGVKNMIQNSPDIGSLGKSRGHCGNDFAIALVSFADVKPVKVARIIKKNEEQAFLFIR